MHFLMVARSPDAARGNPMFTTHREEQVAANGGATFIIKEKCRQQSKLIIHPFSKSGFLFCVGLFYFAIVFIFLGISMIH